MRLTPTTTTHNHDYFRFNHCVCTVLQNNCNPPIDMYLTILSALFGGQLELQTNLMNKKVVRERKKLKSEKICYSP